MNWLERVAMRKFPVLLTMAAGILLAGPAAPAQQVVTNDPPEYGPYNAVFLAGGDGLHKPIAKDDSLLRADTPWTIYLWARSDDAVKSETLVAGLGETHEEYPRYIVLKPDQVELWMGEHNSLSGTADTAEGKWHFHL